MTVVDVQQNPHQAQFDYHHRTVASQSSHPSSHSSKPPSLRHGPQQPPSADSRSLQNPQQLSHAGGAPAVARGSSSAMPSRTDPRSSTAVINPLRAHRVSHSRTASSSLSSSQNDDAAHHDRQQPNLNKRPSSAPGSKQNLVVAFANGSNTEQERGNQPAKPPLLRSKSEHGLRSEDTEIPELADEEHYEWGARHGFEDHYQSEHIISQLANVGAPEILCFPLLCFHPCFCFHPSVLLLSVPSRSPPPYVCSPLFCADADATPTHLPWTLGHTYHTYTLA